MCSRMELRSIPEDCLVVAPDQSIEMCPSSDWQRTEDFLTLVKQIVPLPYKNDFSYAMGPNQIYVADKTSIRQLVSVEDESFLGSGPRPILATTQHAAISNALTSTGALWFLSLTNVTARRGKGSPLSDQLDAVHSIRNGYKQPYSTVVCIPDYAESGNDATPIGIPHLPNANPAATANGNITYEGCFPGLVPSVTAQTIAHPSMTRGQMSNLSSSTTEYILHWTELDPHLFQGSSIGAIIVSPRAPTNTTQNVLICNLSAGWGTAALSMHTSSGGIGPVSSLQQNFNHTTGSVSIQSTNIPPAEAHGNVIDFHLPFYPQQVINVTQEWAEYLNPKLSELNTSVINTLLQNWEFSCSPRTSAEIALSTLLVNGIAKSGVGSSLQGTVRETGPNGDRSLDGDYWLSGKGDVFIVDANQSHDWVKLRVDSTLEGYAYNTATVAPRIAIAFLTIYCVIALGHVVYAAWTGKS